MGENPRLFWLFEIADSLCQQPNFSYGVLLFCVQSERVSCLSDREIITLILVYFVLILNHRVTMYATRFNITKLQVSPTQCIYGLCLYGSEIKQRFFVYTALTLILPRSHMGTVWFYTSTNNKRAARPKLYTKSLTRDLKLMYSRFTLVRISTLGTALLLYRDRRFTSLQRMLFIYLINKYISLSDICLRVHH